MTRISLFLTDVQIRKARQLGKNMDRSMASVIRRALEHYFKTDAIQRQLRVSIAVRLDSTSTVSRATPTQERRSPVGTSSTLVGSEIRCRTRRGEGL